MSGLVREVERTIAVARRSRGRVLRFLDALEGARRSTARAEKPESATRISIALPSLTVRERIIAGVARNLNRRAAKR